MAFKDQRVTFIHQALHEFVLTRTPSQTGLYPLLSLLVLLIQKPLLLVLFTKPLRDVDPVHSDECGWVHSLRFPESLKSAFDQRIAELLLDREDTGKAWIFDPMKEVPEKERHELKEAENIHAVGVFYLNINSGPRSSPQVDDKREPGAGQGLTIKSTIETLCSADQKLIRALFSSIANHTHKDRRPHLHDIVNFSQQAVAACGALFSRSSEVQEHSPQYPGRDIQDLTPVQLATMLQPIEKEIDQIYRDLRGGEADITDDDFDPSKDAGAKLLWSRYRQAKKAGHGIRPPTIAFYMQVRSPLLENVSNERPERGYRIVPIVTRTIARDLAFTLKDNLGRTQTADDVLNYLREIGVPEPTLDLVLEVDKLAEAIYKASSIESYLSEQYYHSFTYLAFSSGIATFTPAMPASRCDRVAYGPDFLAEIDDVQNERDTAFTKVVTISGFPFIGIVTKTRASIERKAKPEFGPYYFNIQFHLGIIRRWVSRRLRSSVERAYITRVEASIIAGLTPPGMKIRTVNAGANEKVYLPQDWCERLNRMLDEAAQAMPYARIKLAFKGAKMDIPEHYQEIVLKDLTIFFWRERNSYFSRKLIDSDLNYLKAYKLEQCMKSALTAVEVLWSKYPREPETARDREQAIGQLPKRPH